MVPGRNNLNQHSYGQHTDLVATIVLAQRIFLSKNRKIINEIDLACMLYFQ